MKVTWRVYRDGGIVAKGHDVDEGFESRDQGNFIWVKLGDPSDDDIRAVADRFDLPDLVVEDALQAHQRPKLERHEDTVLLVLKPAEYNEESEKIALGEVHVIVGDGYVISVRHGSVGSLDGVATALQDNSEVVNAGPIGVMYAIADSVVDEYQPIVQSLDRAVEDIERDVFAPDVAPPTERIYNLMRQVLEFRLATSSLLSPINELAQDGIRGSDVDLSDDFRDVSDHAHSVHEQTENFRELLHGALKANLAFIGLQENRDQRKISSWAALALVPTIIGGIWGMNVPVPLQGSPVGFAVVVLVILVISGWLYQRLRNNQWL